MHSQNRRQYGRPLLALLIILVLTLMQLSNTAIPVAAQTANPTDTPTTLPVLRPTLGRVPITAHYYVSDLAAALGLPVLVVAQNRLGCLNHILLTVESVRRTGLQCAGVILNELGGPGDIAMATNRDVLQKLCNVPVLTGLEEKACVIGPDWGAVLALDEASGLSTS